MNPDSFTGRTDEEILSTPAHEMAHVWQQSPERRRAVATMTGNGPRR